MQDRKVLTKAMCDNYRKARKKDKHEHGGKASRQGKALGFSLDFLRKAQAQKVIRETWSATRRAKYIKGS